MPTVNIYHYPDCSADLRAQVAPLKQLIAKELTCGDILLSEQEVSVRLISVGGGMIGEVEVEIHAHEFQARIERQDEICKIVRSALLNAEPRLKDVRVWLVLSQLGHSW